jgi:uncharacterized protein (TIGR02265 family)
VLPLPASTFEGLFVRSLKPTGAFLADLGRAGFDPARMQSSYPFEVWDACLTVARTHALAGVADADFQLGRRFNQGFLDTVVGSIIKVGIPMLGLRRLIARLPRTVPTAFPGAEVTVLEAVDHRARVRLASSPINADFARGVFHDAAEMAGAVPSFDVSAVRFFPGVGHAFELGVTWP